MHTTTPIIGVIEMTKNSNLFESELNTLGTV